MEWGKIKIDEFKFCVIFEFEYIVDSTVVKIVIGLANWGKGKK